MRNNLEHEFVIVHKSDKPDDIYGSFDFMSDMVFIKEVDFIENLKDLLKLTRSAIFSFVFTVRDKALKEEDNGVEHFPNSIYRQNYDS